MKVIEPFPVLVREPGPEVLETAEVVQRMLDLQRCQPWHALLALKLAADRIRAAPDDTEALQLKAAIRGVAADKKLVSSEGGVVSAEEFGAALGVSRETVNQWRQQGRILGWKRGARNFAYPAWQIHRRALLPGLAEVLAALAPHSFPAMDIADYFLSKSDELNARPLDLLRRGRIESVLEHARRYGEIGA